jgi:hypothetical protein
METKLGNMGLAEKRFVSAVGRLRTMPTENRILIHATLERFIQKLRCTICSEATIEGSVIS